MLSQVKKKEKERGGDGVCPCALRVGSNPLNMNLKSDKKSFLHLGA